jgi:hypothetical protein
MRRGTAHRGGGNRGRTGGPALRASGRSGVYSGPTRGAARTSRRFGARGVLGKVHGLGWRAGLERLCAFGRAEHATLRSGVRTVST